MTEDRLKALKEMPVPPPRDAARKAALAAAMATFDAPAADAAEKSSDAPQGSDGNVRLLSASHPGVRRKLMSFTKFQYGMAASVAALMIAAPMALHTMRDQPSRMLGKVDSKVGGRIVGGENGPATGRIAEQAPAKPVAVPQEANRRERGIAITDKLAKEKQAKTERSQQQVAAVPVSPPPPPASVPADAYRSSLGAAGRKDHDASVAKRQLGQVMGGAAPGLAAVPSQAPGAYRAAAEAKSDDRMANLTLPRPDPSPVQVQEEHRDRFEGKPDNPVKQVAAEPVSTFSLDVDTASYSFVRRALNAGLLPQKDAVRVEEMINYFPYDYARPETADVPFQPQVSVFPAPWNAEHKLVHIGIKGYELKSAERPRANLVFLVDVSGSMSPEDRLPLVKNAFRLLLDELKPDDTVGIVTYASGSGVALEPTKVSDKGKILAAIDRLGAGGSTAGAQGITDAYRLADANFDAKAVNRIILATDGDFNVGITSRDELKGFIERKRDKGIFLSILGVGRGNYNDAMMQALAQNGNGTAAYVDTLNEARKVLVDEASSTLFPIAKDVKIQVEFNPALVSEYRLIGYETRILKREDFNNDKVDAGEVGSGHTVTAIYEITPAGAAPSSDPLRYGPVATKTQPERAAAPTSEPGELGFLKMRYKLPKEDTSRLLTLPIARELERKSAADAPNEARFSTAVAAFGQLLRGSPYLKGYGFDDVIALAQGAKGADPFGYRAEFVNLVRLARSARP